MDRLCHAWLIVLPALLSGLVGCGGKDSAENAHPVSRIHRDTAGLRSVVDLRPAGEWSVRWTTISVAELLYGQVPASRLDVPGPTDACTILLAKSTGDENAIAPLDSSRRMATISLPLAIVDSLLPSRILAKGVRDSVHWSLRDSLRGQPFPHTSWVGDGMIFRVEGSWLAEYCSH